MNDNPILLYTTNIWVKPLLAYMPPDVLVNHIVRPPSAGSNLFVYCIMHGCDVHDVHDYLFKTLDGYIGVRFLCVMYVHKNLLCVYEYIVYSCNRHTLASSLSL